MSAKTTVDQCVQGGLAPICSRRVAIGKPTWAHERGARSSGARLAGLAGTRASPTVLDRGYGCLTTVLYLFVAISRPWRTALDGADTSGTSAYGVFRIAYGATVATVLYGVHRGFTPVFGYFVAIAPAFVARGNRARALGA